MFEDIQHFRQIQKNCCSSFTINFQFTIHYNVIFLVTVTTKLPVFTVSFFIKCDVLRDLVAFVQFKNREKHPWRNVTFSKVAG